jgi:hypothetical protein
MVCCESACVVYPGRSCKAHTPLAAAAAVALASKGWFWEGKRAKQKAAFEGDTELQYCLVAF